MSNKQSDSIQQVREAAREQTKDIDEYAVCCSDGDFEYARTEDVALDIRDEMRSMRESLQPSESHEYDVITLGANEGSGGR
jgi:hypothetical protein